MTYTVILHIPHSNPVMGETEKLPLPTDNLITIINPRTKDGKDIPYLEESATSVIWPITQLTFIEVLPGGEEEEIIGFVRE